MRTIIITLSLIILTTASALAEDFTWMGWFGPDGSNSAWGHSWASENDTYTNGWGNTWIYYADPVPYFPGSDDWVHLPDGVVLDIEGGVPARCGNLTIAPDAQLLFPQSTVTIHGPDLINEGHVHAWGITTMGGSFVVVDSLNISGAGDIQLDSARLQSDNAEAVIVLGPDQIIHGRGALGYQPYGNYHGFAITNHGIIRATGSTAQLDILGTEVTNLGSVEAVDASMLRIWGSWDNASGELLASGASTIWLCNETGHDAHIRGGVLRTTGDGMFRMQSASCVQDLTLEGYLWIPRYDAGHMAGIITNNGIIDQGFNNGAGPATVYVDSALTFLGDGELRLGFGNTLKMRNWPDHQALVTNGPDHTIISDGGYLGENPNYYGDQRIELVNEGTIVCQDSPYNNEFRTTGFTNRGTVEIQPTATTTAQVWGEFTQTAGKLECDDVLRIQDGGFHFSGGVLAGAGGLQGNVSVGGTAVIHPGDEGEIGTLDIWGNLTLNQGATLVYEAMVGGKDRLAVHGAMLATGSITVRIEHLELDPAKSGEYVMLTCDDLDDQAAWTLELPEGWEADGLEWHGNDLVATGLSTSLTGAPDLPQSLALHGAAPNPFNPSTTISFSLDGAGPVTLQVVDVAGRRVRTLIQGEMPAGLHDAHWDGCDDAGRHVSSGTYLCVLETAAGRVSRAMTLVK